MEAINSLRLNLETTWQSTVFADDSAPSGTQPTLASIALLKILSLVTKYRLLNLSLI